MYFIIEDSLSIRKVGQGALAILVIKHRSGKANANADALSRNPAAVSCAMVEASTDSSVDNSSEKVSSEEDTENGSDQCDALLPPDAAKLDEIRSSQLEDPTLAAMCRYIEHGSTKKKLRSLYWRVVTTR